LKTSSPWSVEVQRGSSTESVHQVLASVVDASGKEIQAVGDTQFATYPRSSIKFLQAIPFVESGAWDAKNLELSHLALACASHQSEEFHLQILSQWLEKLGLEESDLVCGAHEPAHAPTAKQFLLQRKKLTRLMNNCSGKHLGMLTTALHLGEKTEGYHRADHPVQMRITKILVEFSGHANLGAHAGIDGCGIPTYFAPLKNWALAMAGLLKPQVSSERQNAVGQILKAVEKFPELVSGSEHLSVKVQKITENQMILKSGAEGFYTGLFPGKSLAFALKVVDGNARATAAALGEIALLHGDFSSEIIKKLDFLRDIEIQNTRGEVVGHVRLKK